MGTSYTRMQGRRFRQMTYEQARFNAQAIGFTSREKYLMWHHKNKPMWIPRYPDRAYPDEWEGWNAFLGTNNVFGNQHHLRINHSGKVLPYWEAVRLMHTLVGPHSITTQREYHKWYRENEGELPIIDHLPLHPDKYYDDWSSWYVWLGKTVEGKLTVASESAKAVSLLCLVRDPSLPQNVATVVKCKDGKPELMLTLQEKGWEYVRVYQYSEEDEELFWQIIDQLSTPFHGTRNQRLCGMGAAQMLSELDMQLLRAPFP